MPEEIKKLPSIQFMFHQPEYTIQAHSENYLICTRLYLDTTTYVLVDRKNRFMGTEDGFHAHRYATRELCQERLAELESGELKISLSSRSFFAYDWIKGL